MTVNGDVATWWTGVDMYIPLLPRDVPGIDVDLVSFFSGEERLKV